MDREFRVQTQRTRVSDDGQTVVVVLKGTQGTAHDARRVPGGGVSCCVYWDAVLLNDEGLPNNSSFAESWEDPDVFVEDLIFLGVTSPSHPVKE